MNRALIENISEDLQALTEHGPRFMGTTANEAAVRYLVDRFNQYQGVEARTEEFSYLGWSPRQAPSLRVIDPEPREIACVPYIYCGATPEGGISGELRELGEHWVIGDYKWDKFAIVKDGVIQGHISGRRDGVAIQQPLSEFSDVLPHFSVGTDSAAWFRERIGNGETVTVEGTIDVELDPAAQAENVMAVLPGRGKDRKRIIVCSHVDSMYVCPGANDNASGMAATLALADHFAQNPLLHDVLFVVFNGEEWDLAGSKAYAAEFFRRGWLDELEFVVNLDGIAYSDEHVQIWAGPEPFEEEIRKTLKLGGMLTQSEPKVTLVSPPPMGADHVPFYNFGIPSCMFTGYEMVRYHTELDVYEERLAANVFRVAEMAGSIIERFDVSFSLGEVRGQVQPQGWEEVREAIWPAMCANGDDA